MRNINMSERSMARRMRRFVARFGSVISRYGFLADEFEHRAFHTSDSDRRSLIGGDTAPCVGDIGAIRLTILPHIKHDICLWVYRLGAAFRKQLYVAPGLIHVLARPLCRQPGPVCLHCLSTCRLALRIPTERMECGTTHVAEPVIIRANAWQIVHASGCSCK